MASPKQINEITGRGIDRASGVDNPFAGTDYEALWENNPYTYLYYEPTFWDKIGLSNKAKDQNAEYQRLYDEYISGIYEQQRQDEYNSESAQVQRQRQAGLNPDLLGVENSQTGQMSPPNAGPQSALNGVSPAFNAFQTITSVLGFATSSLQAINQIKGLSLDNQSKRVSNFNSFIEMARPHIISEYARRFSGQDVNNWSDIANVSSMHMRSKDAKLYKHAFNSLLSSSHFTASESAWKQLSADDRAMKHFIGGMVDLELEFMKSDYKGRTRDANTKGFLQKWRNEFYERLYDDFKRGSDLAGLLLLGSGNTSLTSIGAIGLNQIDRGVSNTLTNYVIPPMKKFYNFARNKLGNF